MAYQNPYGYTNFNPPGTQFNYQPNFPPPIAAGLHPEYASSPFRQQPLFNGFSGGDPQRMPQPPQHHTRYQQQQMQQIRPGAPYRNQTPTAGRPQKRPRFNNERDGVQETQQAAPSAGVGRRIAHEASVRTNRILNPRPVSPPNTSPQPVEAQLRAQIQDLTNRLETTDQEFAKCRQKLAEEKRESSKRIAEHAKELEIYETGFKELQPALQEKEDEIEKLTTHAEDLEEQLRVAQLSNAHVAGNVLSTGNVVDGKKTRCEDCRHQISERDRLHKDVNSLRDELFQLKTLSNEREREKERLIEKANASQQRLIEKANETQRLLDQERLERQRSVIEVKNWDDKAKKLLGDVELMKQARDRSSAALEKERLNSKALTAEIEKERAKSTTLAAELELAMTELAKVGGKHERCKKQLIDTTGKLKVATDGNNDMQKHVKAYNEMKKHLGVAAESMSQLKGEHAKLKTDVGELNNAVGQQMKRNFELVMERLASASQTIVKLQQENGELHQKDAAFQIDKTNFEDQFRKTMTDLKKANDELSAANDKLRQRTDDLSEVQRQLTTEKRTRVEWEKVIANEKEAREKIEAEKKKQLDEQRDQFKRAMGDWKSNETRLETELRAAKEDSTAKEQQLQKAKDEKLKVDTALTDVKRKLEETRGFLQSAKEEAQGSTTNIGDQTAQIKKLEETVNRMAQQLQLKEEECREAQQKYNDVFAKCERHRAEIEQAKNLRDANRRLWKLRDELLRKADDANLRSVRLQEAKRVATERNVQNEDRIRVLETAHQSQSKYQNKYNLLLGLTYKYKSDAGELAQQHGDPPEIREQLTVCLERVMDQFTSEAAQIHNTE